MIAPPAAASPSHALAAWRIGCWIVLLLAVFGGWQYLRLHDYAYFFAALALMLLSAATLLRHAWARTPMRVAALLLALWALATAGVMLGQFGQFDEARRQGVGDPMLLWVIDQAQHSFQLALLLKLLLLPLLLWLAWALGRPRVVAQFRRLR